MVLSYLRLVELFRELVTVKPLSAGTQFAVPLLMSELQAVEPVLR